MHNRMNRQEKKAAEFRALHAGQAFLIPNPWDAGSARVLAALDRATDLPPVG
jgi:2-methylisocitrate lyase-like PEP mutase family enzyme